MQVLTAFGLLSEVGCGGSCGNAAIAMNDGRIKQALLRAQVKEWIEDPVRARPEEVIIPIVIVTELNHTIRNLKLLEEC